MTTQKPSALMCQYFALSPEQVDVDNETWKKWVEQQELVMMRWKLRDLAKDTTKQDCFRARALSLMITVNTEAPPFWMPKDANFGDDSYAIQDDLFKGMSDELKAFLVAFAIWLTTGSKHRTETIIRSCNRIILLGLKYLPETDPLTQKAFDTYDFGISDPPPPLETDSSSNAFNHFLWTDLPLKWRKMGDKKARTIVGAYLYSESVLRWMNDRSPKDLLVNQLEYVLQASVEGNSPPIYWFTTENLLLLIPTEHRALRKQILCCALFQEDGKHKCFYPPRLESTKSVEMAKKLLSEFAEEPTIVAELMRLIAQGETYLQDKRQKQHKRDVLAKSLDNRMRL